VGNWLGYTNPVYYAHKRGKKEERKKKQKSREEQVARNVIAAERHNAGLTGGFAAPGSALLTTKNVGSAALVRGV